jgi:hypothetical protein
LVREIRRLRALVREIGKHDRSVLQFRGKDGH